MECVKQMVDYIPNELWERKSIKVLDPCAGNGNFPAYLMYKTNKNNIWLNDLNEIRIENARKLLDTDNVLNEDFFNLRSLLPLNWDLIIANPPYSGGRNKNTSLSNSFIEESIDLLNEKGYLCFITPNNWMTYNNNNKLLKKLLTKGSFLIIDNNVKRYFPSVGSSFTVFVWQKNVFDNKTKVINNYLLKDIKENIKIPSNLPFIPLYISQEIIDLIPKIIVNERNSFDYRCDLHNFTRKDLLNDLKSEHFKYETIHTARKTRYASIKQDIYDKWIIVVPLSTYYIPYLQHKVNVTQSVGYIPFNSEKEAKKYLKIIKEPIYKVFVHLTRYGNFNNIKVLRHISFGKKIDLTQDETIEINKLNSLIKY
jgi:SAM-dependent methyltransferase